MPRSAKRVTAWTTPARGASAKNRAAKITAAARRKAAPAVASAPADPLLAFATPRHRALWPLVVRTMPPDDVAHDALHLRRVYVWALRLAPEAGVDADLAGATALVHDLSAIPKDSPDRAAGGERAALMAAEPLIGAGYDPETEVPAILEAVRTSSWSRGFEPTTPLGALLQDADRLDAIGAVGIARCFATGQRMSRPEAPGRFYDPLDPFAERGRPLDDRQQALDHFARKLLKLVGGFHLPSAVAEATRRHAAMRAFLDELRQELQ